MEYSNYSWQIIYPKSIENEAGNGAEPAIDFSLADHSCAYIRDYDYDYDSAA